MTYILRPVKWSEVVIFILALSLPVSAAASTSCGSVGDECCSYGPPCESGATCVEGTCEQCGGSDEICCDGGVCNSGLICSEVSDDTLGGSGAGGFSNTGTCVPCGGSNQPCCEEDQCNTGLVCLDPAESPATGGGAGPSISGPTCVPCGALGQSCCQGGVCDSPGLLCGSVVCEACGGVGQQCCAGPNRCPLSRGECIDNVCRAGAAVPALRGGGLVALILALLSVAVIASRRSLRRS